MPLVINLNEKHESVCLKKGSYETIETNIKLKEVRGKNFEIRIFNPHCKIIGTNVSEKEGLSTYLKLYLQSKTFTPIVINKTDKIGELYFYRKNKNYPIHAV